MPVIRLGFLLYGVSLVPQYSRVPKGPVHQRHRRRHPAGGEAATAPETMAMVAVKGVRAPDGDGDGSMAAVTATRVLGTAAAAAAVAAAVAAAAVSPRGPRSSSSLKT